MTPVTIFDNDGRITLAAEVSDSTLALYEMMYVGRIVTGAMANPQTEYIVDGKIQPRPGSPVALTGGTLANLPMPCTITINGTAYPCEDDGAELDLLYPGIYKIKVFAFPYLDAEFEVTI